MATPESTRDLLESTGPKFEHTWLTLQYHKGVAGLGKGWDNTMIAQIEQLGAKGFELVSAVEQQKNPTWFILFFKRQVS